MSITTDISWVQAHLLSLALVVLLSFGGVYGVESIVAKHDDATAKKFQIIASDQAAQNKAFQTQISQQISYLQEQNVEQNKEIAVLTSALSARAIVEKKVQVTTHSLDAEQVAEGLGGTAVGDVVSLPLPKAQDALTAELLVPLLQADKNNLTDTVAAERKISDNNLAEYTSEKAAHDSDNKTNATIILADKKELVAAKADARKAKIKWFVIGYVSGFISGIAAHAAGI